MVNDQQYERKRNNSYTNLKLDICVLNCVSIELRHRLSSSQILYKCGNKVITTDFIKDQLKSKRPILTLD